MNEITNPHDKLFREAWSNKETARDFLQNYLPPSVLSLVQLDSLEIRKDSLKVTKEDMLKVVKETLSERGGDAVMTLAEQWIHEGYEQGLAEAIELGISIRFGDEYLDDLMPSVRSIHKPAQLKRIKNAIKQVQDISELKTIIAHSN